MLLTRPLRGFLLFHPVVVGGVVPIVGKADPRPCDANAGVPVVVVADPSPRQVGRPPGFSKLAHSAGGHGAVTLGRHISRVSENQKMHKDFKGLAFRDYAAYLSDMENTGKRHMRAGVYLE